MEDLIIKYLPKFDFPNIKGETFATIVDTETTGLSETDEIVELTMLRFYFDNDFNITGYDEPVSMLHEPTIPITEESSNITGITMDMVRGHKIDPKVVTSYLDGSVLLIAHNAKFDRNKMEKYIKIPDFYWGCTMKDINWEEKGWTSRTQEFLAFKYGFYYNAHRSEEDCLALLHILNKDTNLHDLANRALMPEETFIFENTRYDEKDIIKNAGGRWNPEEKHWYIERPKSSSVIEEIERKLSSGRIVTKQIDPLYRFKNVPA